MKDPARPPANANRAQRAAELAQRDLFIAHLVRDGESVEDVARLARLTARQIRRIVAVAESPAAGPPADDERLLTPLEARDLRREHGTDPAALAWVAAQRLDRRRDGRPDGADSRDALDHAVPLGFDPVDPASN